MGLIPVRMEMFNAADEEQCQVITRTSVSRIRDPESVLGKNFSNNIVETDDA